MAEQRSEDAAPARVRLDNRVESRIGALIQRFFESPFEVKARRESHTEWRRYSEPTDIDESYNTDVLRIGPPARFFQDRFTVGIAFAF